MMWAAVISAAIGVADAANASRAAHMQALAGRQRPHVKCDPYPLLPPRSPTWWDAYKPLVLPLAYALAISSPLWIWLLLSR